MKKDIKELIKIKNNLDKKEKELEIIDKNFEPIYNEWQKANNDVSALLNEYTSLKHKIADKYIDNLLKEHLR